MQKKELGAVQDFVNQILEDFANLPVSLPGVAKLLRGLARQQQNYVLSQIATRVRSDPFVKIRGLVEEMISKLVKEAAEEADQKAFCDEETSESKAMFSNFYSEFWLT